eukprot:2280911-Amphidinium_carterae.1
MRFLLSWHTSRCNPSLTDSNSDDNQALSSLDYTGAFLNADLPEGRTIVLRPPNIFVWLGVIKPNTYWLLHKALYGLRKSPMLWGATRDKGFSNVRITHKGDVYKLLQTVTHPSLWMIVKLSDVEEVPVLTNQDLPIKVIPALVHGLIGVFVDDLLKTGTHGLLTSVITRIRKLWKAGDPDFLTPQ